MDVLNTLVVRFHVDDKFLNKRRIVQFVGGREAMSYIDRDKVSYPEIVRHLRDHIKVAEGTLLHWQFSGMSLNEGLKVLYDDKSVLEMANCIVESGVADIYVETPPISQLKGKGITTGSSQAIQILEMKAQQEPQEEGLNKEDTNSGDESSDSEYFPGDEAPSEEDDEAQDILRKFKAFKKKLKKGEAATLDDVVLGEATALAAGGFVGLEADGNGTPYFDSDDEESMDGVGSDGEYIRKHNEYPRFKKTKDVPKFCLGMKFNGKKVFKKAIIRYALAERKVINFKKDDAKRVRAKCDWPTCPWVCLLSDTSRTDSWQITTFHDLHTCPPRRDNRHVTAARIAERYEKFIIANPLWNLTAMQQTVQEEMFANVSISKLKKAKAMVMHKALDSSKGQYERLYDYQLELLRSNPGSTVIVHKVPNTDPPTFQRMYICLAACKRGFMDGCRKVIGLDGCFFKGAMNGELLCAIGRDANNQMYPIAWAVLEVENNASWDWFCALLCKDVCVAGGARWMFISDQQKGILDAVSKWAPEAEHRNCARHIYANWKKHFRNKEWQKNFGPVPRLHVL